MKYRSIRGAAHNFVHSFMSWPNQIHGSPICEELYRILRDRTNESIVIDWLKKGDAEDSLLPPNVRASVDQRRSILSKFMARHGIPRYVIADFKMTIFCDAAHQIRVAMDVTDDRGRKYTKIMRV